MVAEGPGQCGRSVGVVAGSVGCGRSSVWSVSGGGVCVVGQWGGGGGCYTTADWGSVSPDEPSITFSLNEEDSWWIRSSVRA